MTRPQRGLGLLSVMLALACTQRAPPIQREVPDPATSATSAATAGGAQVAPAPVAASVETTGTVDELPFALREGMAEAVPWGMRITLADGPVACGAKPTGSALRFEVRAGPGARYYVGSTFGAAMEIGRAASWDRIEPSAALVSVDRAEVRDAGTIAGSFLVRSKAPPGHLAVDARGTFAVPMCGPVPPYRGIDDTSQPAIMKPRSVIAFRHRESPPGVVDTLWVFPDQYATCNTPYKPSRFSFYSLDGIGSPSVGDRKATGPQPAVLWHHPALDEDVTTGGSSFPEGEAAIVWDAFDARPGGTLRGRVTWMGADMRLTRVQLAVKVCAR
jgi:hypothetical protein